MIISLVGMSNVGKSYWSKKFEEEQGFVRLCCDDLIAQELTECLPEIRIHDMDAFAAWLGTPQEFGYQEREAAYLDCEQQALLYAIEQATLHEDTIIDTTGSVICLSDAVLKKLGQISTVVYLETTPQHIVEMIEKFTLHPKPLVWGAHKSYPELLAWRVERYRLLTNVTIPYEASHSPDFTSDKLLYEILQHQRQNTSG